MVYYKLSLDRKVSKIWKKQKVCRKLNRKMSFSEPVESILVSILEKSRAVKNLGSVYMKYKIKMNNILDEVIGNDYFGLTQNRKRFYYLVNKIITQSRFECVYLSSLSKGYNMGAMTWLQDENLDESATRKLLQNTNLFLLRYVVKTLIKHFYHPLKAQKGYGIQFVERPKWHSFQHKVLNELLRLKFLTAVAGKHPCRGELKLFPKTTCDSLEYRPIIYPKRYCTTTKARMKRLSSQIEKLADTFSKIGKQSLFISWKKYCKEAKGQQVYGIKLDIKDAFGYIDINKVSSIIKQSRFSMSDKLFIINHIQHQYVNFHKKLYRWNHGLLQGDCLSPSLCNLFMSDFEKEHLQEFHKPGCFLHRQVDDYFFCSLRKEDVYRFELKVKSVFQLNEAKTQKIDDNNCELSYDGHIINLKTMEVMNNYNLKKECPFRHKFKLWNSKNPIAESSKHYIISKALDFSYNNHCFKRLELNTNFNREETVLKNYFEGMTFVAFKFDVAVMAVREFQQAGKDMQFLIDILEKTVHEYSNIIFYKIKLYKGEYFTGDITFMLLKNIAYRAFIVVLRKNNEFYKHVINYIKKKDLYLSLKTFSVSPNEFTALPKVFQNVRMSRKSAL